MIPTDSSIFKKTREKLAEHLAPEDAAYASANDAKLSQCLATALRKLYDAMSLSGVEEQLGYRYHLVPTGASVLHGISAGLSGTPRYVSLGAIPSDHPLNENLPVMRISQVQSFSADITPYVTITLDTDHGVPIDATVIICVWKDGGFDMHGCHEATALDTRTFKIANNLTTVSPDGVTGYVTMLGPSPNWVSGCSFTWTGKRIEFGFKLGQHMMASVNVSLSFDYEPILENNTVKTTQYVGIDGAEQFLVHYCAAAYLQTWGGASTQTQYRELFIQATGDELGEDSTGGLLYPIIKKLVDEREIRQPSYWNTIDTPSANDRLLYSGTYPYVR